MKKAIVLFGISLVTQYGFSQDWRLGGNTDFGPPPASGLVSNSNYFGSLQNTPIRIGTNSFNRMIIDNGPGIGNAGLTGGRITIGNNLPNNFAPQSRLHIHQTGGAGINSTYIRFTNNFTGSGPNNGFAIGNTNSVCAF